MKRRKDKRKDLLKFMAELEDEARFKLAIAETCGVSPTMIRKEAGGQDTIDKKADKMTLIPEYIFAIDRAIKTILMEKMMMMPSKVKPGYMKKMSIIKQDSSIIAMKCTYGNGIKVRYTGGNTTEHGATGDIAFPTGILLINLKNY